MENEKFSTQLLPNEIELIRPICDAFLRGHNSITTKITNDKRAEYLTEKSLQYNLPFQLSFKASENISSPYQYGMTKKLSKKTKKNNEK